jgi:hypothetical protein
VHFSSIRVVKGLALAGVAGALVACGGGGGGSSSGGPGAYVVTLTAAKTELPTNIMGVQPGIGVNSPYTTTMYVSAKRANSGDPIPGGDDVFACNVVGGLDSAVLYKLDGTDEEDDDGNPIASRSLVLGANAGAASFHLHATNTPGTATVRCAVDDNGTQRDTTINIAVGLSTGKPSQVVVNAAAPEYVFVQGIGQTTQILLQAQILDDAGAIVPNPAAGVNNLYARIVPTVGTADDDAKLRGTGADNTWVKARSVSGQASFTLVSGATTGSVLIEVLSDRADNDVDNGVSQVVSNIVSVPVVAAVGMEALAIQEAGALPAATEGKSYAAIVQASGGVPPYVWSLVPGTSLPAGLSLSSDGVIYGTPSVDGPFSFALRVRDSATLQQTAQAVYTISIGAAPDPEPAALQIATSSLPNGTVGDPYAAILVATGGSGTYSWSADNLPPGLAISAAGVITGTPTLAGTYPVAFTVNGGGTASRIVNIVIN